MSCKDRSAFRKKAEELVALMTTEEKVDLMSGLDTWHTKPVERLGIPSVMFSDGPHGLRKQLDSGDNLGIGESVPAVCFPAAVTMASIIKEIPAADVILNIILRILLYPALWEVRWCGGFRVPESVPP